MSKKMTPCEKLGYKVGDKFTVIKDSYFEKGTIVVLSEDDGSEVPWFTCGSVRRALIIGSNPDVEPSPSKLNPAKQALADAIHQNGGWRGGKYAVYGKHSGKCSFLTCKPQYLAKDHGWFVMLSWIVGEFEMKPFINWHQCVLSREEYYHAYPKADADGWIEHDGKHEPAVATSGLTLWCRWSDGLEQSHEANMVDWIDDSDVRIIAYRLHKQEAKPEFCESVMRSIPEPESIDGLCAKVTEENKHQHVDAKPTIEQLAQDYRNKLDFANSKQKEADEAKAAADAALGELERAGEELGLLIGIAKPAREPELVITDWRDLQVNDVIFVGECDGYESGEYVVVWLEDSDYDGDFAVIVVGIDGIERCMDTAMEWRVIRRP